MKTLFVTATDTEVGKTYVSSSILHQVRVKKVRVQAVKPLQSGAGLRDPESDIRRLCLAAGTSGEEEQYCFWHSTIPMAPYAIMKEQGQRFELNELLINIAALPACDFRLIEGAGGLRSPLGTDFDNLKLAKAIGAPVLVLAPAGLGTINQSLLSVERLLSEGLKVSALILNRGLLKKNLELESSNKAILKEQLGIPVLGVLGQGELLSTLPDAFPWIENLLV